MWGHRGSTIHSIQSTLGPFSAYMKHRPRGTERPRERQRESERDSSEFMMCVRLEKQIEEEKKKPADVGDCSSDVSQESRRGRENI